MTSVVEQTFINIKVKKITHFPEYQAMKSFIEGYIPRNHTIGTG
jgi:hypothetical protein